MVEKKTKIIATIGPASETEMMLKKISEEGVNVFRLNFSHGSYTEHGAKIEKIRRLGLPGAILLDTKGPEIRTKDVNGKFEIKAGDKFIITVTSGNSYEISGKIGVSYKEFIKDIDVGDNISIDGNLVAKAIKKTDTDIEFEVLSGHTNITSNRHINVYGKHVSLPTVTESDWKDIDFGIEQRLDYIALSFARTEEDVNEVRQYCAKKGWPDIKIISKVENLEALENIESLIRASDGIMIARGDLADEAGYAKVPVIHKEIIKLCAFYKKPVIVATQMLSSMVTQVNPTRAEASDVANAIFDGADAIMLSEETTKSSDPSHVVQVMAGIAKEAELAMYGDEEGKGKELCGSETLCQCNMDLFPLYPDLTQDLDAIVIISSDYDITRKIANARVPAPIYSFIDREIYMNQMALIWNTRPFMMKISDDFESNVKIAEQELKKCPHIKKYLLVSDVSSNGKKVLTVQSREL